ncbi:unnamed protein product [Enterobius vermicularis]|uniref:DDE_Tnp_1_7 domain-containing protein n=1 Tax=Enterobius vermicularis TaxID=51028 RepID=A0A0N4VHD0_ENTVE|nr:unnamed protein product [Enterobius vermicularis]
MEETIDLDFDEYDDFESVRLPGVEHNISLEQSNEKKKFVFNGFVNPYQDAIEWVMELIKTLFFVPQFHICGRFRERWNLNVLELVVCLVFWLI